MIFVPWKEVVFSIIRMKSHVIPFWLCCLALVFSFIFGSLDLSYSEWLNLLFIGGFFTFASLHLLQLPLCKCGVLLHYCILWYVGLYNKNHFIVICDFSFKTHRLFFLSPYYFLPEMLFCNPPTSCEWFLLIFPIGVYMSCLSLTSHNLSCPFIIISHDESINSSNLSLHVRFFLCARQDSRYWGRSCE